MSWWEDHQTKKKVKKEQKKINAAEKRAETLTTANDTLTELADRREKAKHKEKIEEQYAKHLDKSRLEDEISEVREKLFIQRKKLLMRFINFNREYRYVCAQPDSPVKKDELKRCSVGSKNAAYALAVVEEAISRLDNIHSEYEWREIIRDLTKGYKMMNAISIGSDMMTRLAFLLQKARYEIKGDLSVEAMEYYYGRPIDKLLQEQKIDKVATEMLVKDEALDLDNEQQILEAIRWGRIYNVQPSEIADAAQEQSLKARKNHGTPIYDNPEETYENPIDLDAALDNLPSMM